VYFVVIDDDDIIVPNNGSDLSLALYNNYISSYYAGQSTVPGAFNMYKTHLLSLYGTLDFSGVTSISSIMTTKRDTILNYIPYVTSLVFDGCSELLMQDANTMTTSFDFSNMPNLTSVSMNGCNKVIGILDFTSNP
jgi:hypothetical protein